MFFKKITVVTILNADDINLDILSEYQVDKNRMDTFFAQKQTLKKIKKTKKGSHLILDCKNVEKNSYLGISYKHLESLVLQKSTGTILHFDDKFKCDDITFYDSKFSIKNGLRTEISFHLRNSKFVTKNSIMLNVELHLDECSIFKGVETIIKKLSPSLMNQSAILMDENSYIHQCLSTWFADDFSNRFEANIVDLFEVQTHSKISKSSLISIYGTPDIHFNEISNQKLDISFNKFVSLFVHPDKHVTAIKNNSRGEYINIELEERSKIDPDSYEYTRPNFIKNTLKNEIEKSKTKTKVNIQEKIKEKALEFKEKRESELFELLQLDFPTDHINSDNRVNYIEAIKCLDLKNKSISKKEMANLKKLKIMFDIKDNQLCKF